MLVPYARKKITMFPISIRSTILTSWSARSSPTTPSASSRPTSERTATTSFWRLTCPASKKEDIHVDVADDRLTVSAERHSNFEDKDKKGNYLRCERSYGSYARSFDISGIDAAGIKAAYADGVLRVTLPKQKEVPASSRRLEIE